MMRPYHRACAVLFFMQGLCASSWAARIPSLAQALALEDARLGTVLFCAPMGSLLMMPWAGLWVARANSRRLTTGAVAGQALAVVGIGCAPTAATLMAALFVYGLTNTLVQIAINAQAVLTQRRAGTAWMATYHGMWSVGGLAGALGATLMTKLAWSPLQHFAWLALAMVPLALAQTRALLHERAPAASVAAPAWAWPAKGVLRMGLLAVAAMFCETAMFDWSGIYLLREAHLAAPTATLTYAAMMGAMAVGRFGADGVVQRYGVHTALCGGASATLLGLTAAVLWPTPMVATLSFVGVGLGLSALVPLMMSVVGQQSHGPVSIALAWASTLGFCGALAAPPTLGWLAQAFGLRPGFMLVCAVAAVLNVALWGRPISHRSVAKASTLG